MRSGLPSTDSLAAPKTAHVLDPSEIYTCLRRIKVRLERHLLAFDVALRVSPLCVLVTPQTCVFFGSGPLRLSGLTCWWQARHVVESALEGTSMDANPQH